MSIAHLLEDFGSGPASHTISMSDVSLEEQRLQSFESGYKAGWEDAVKAQNQDAARISTDFAANLEDLSFTFQEAQSSLMSALRPLLTGMVASVLPRLAHDTLGARVIETLEDMARTATGGGAELVTSPDNVEALEKLLQDNNIMPAKVTGEVSLGEGQVHLRLGKSEREIDLDTVLSQIDTALSGFLDDLPADISPQHKDTA
ncbi:flagellar biosynthesis protein [Rhodobacteraceae bacterium KMM 6894]|nr:flagellar biosynthesis protein [Rhodobacteraceae bacterium KMM 6894]